MSEQPNILLVTTDEQRWDYLGYHGTPGLNTPVLDRLAAEGRAFDNAYCTMPLCTPSRVSVLSGQYPSRHGAYSLGVLTDFTFPTLPGLLSAAGYHSSIIGKTHFAPRNVEASHVAGRLDPPPARRRAPRAGEGGYDPSRFGSTDYVPKSADAEHYGDEKFWSDFDGPYVGFDLVRHCHGHTSDSKPAEHYRAWLAQQGADMAEMDALHDRSRYDCGSWPIPEQYTQTAWINDEAIRNIRKQQQAGRPWFNWVSYQDPHFPYICPEPYYSAVDMRGVDLGGWIEGEFENKPPWYKRLAATGRFGEFSDQWWFPGPIRYENNKQPAKAIQAYIGMCNMIDVYLGRLLDSLRDMGALDNTLVVFTTDHGDHLGRHGLWWKGLAPYDDVQKVPLILWWPGASQGAPTGRTEALASLVDLPVTLLDAAGAEPAVGMQGRSLLPVLTGEAESVRDWVLVECMATPNVYQQTLVADDHKLVLYRDQDYGELYNLREDPDQLKNLWSSPAHSDLKARMMHTFARACMEKDGGWSERISLA